MFLPGASAVNIRSLTPIAPEVGPLFISRDYFMKNDISFRNASQIIRLVALLGVIVVFVVAINWGDWIALLLVPWLLFLDHIDDRIKCPKCCEAIHGVYRFPGFELKSLFTPRYCRCCGQDLEAVKFSLNCSRLN